MNWRATGSSEEQNPTHQYSTPGNYTVSLTATTSGILIYDTTEWKKTDLKDIGVK